jgi:hypothetical protein
MRELTSPQIALPLYLAAGVVMEWACRQGFIVPTYAVRPRPGTRLLVILAWPMLVFYMIFLRDGTEED